ncbi:DNA polymerase II [Motiliproteus sediminis]|uniref:DNA polymerase II n=1 Tax=Motiliproteus sediminis TaxID=1468178 RepID=UPI001AEFEFEC|nr:DNA polymerase II [Motiliproteus sediminis]
MTHAFLLTQQCLPSPQGLVFQYWVSSDQGPLELRVEGQEAVCFYPRAQQTLVEQSLARIAGWRTAELRLCDVDLQPVNALYLPALDSLYRARDVLRAAGVTLYEEDIRPAERYLMERFIGAGMEVEADTVEQWPGGVRSPLHDPRLRASDYRPRLRLLSLDIETAIDHHELYSIGLAGEGLERVLMKGQGEDSATLRFLPDERALLKALEQELADFDPDLIVGWNLIQFDIRYLVRCAERCGVSLHLGRGGAPLSVRQGAAGQWRATLPGRVLVDGIEALRGSTFQFDSFALDNVAQELLGRGKLIEGSGNRGLEITRLYRENPVELAAYNLEDCRLVLEIFAVARLTEYLVERASLTGLTMDRVGGSAAAFDHLYLPRMHRQGMVAPAYASGAQGLDSPGGYVMDSRPGLYDHVLVLDFKSLYPSIIRTFLVDPAGLYRAPALADTATVEGFNGARFDRGEPILPALLAELWRARDKAKAAANTPLATAIKIIMNAFYGVLGSPQCRFFDQRLSGSITLRGHQVLTESADYVDERGYTVIYGDTDSLFVWLNRAVTANEADQIGQQLSAELNGWWRQRLSDEFALESFLEIEYETHYRRFLMPTIRGSEKGSKKRYAGVVGEGKQARMVFKGLESVRSDWTALARQFQQELYRRIFAGESYQTYLCDTVAALRAGELDDQLVYRKRLRQPLDEYQRSQPPHVRAARLERQRAMAQGIPWEPGRRRVHYLMTVNGPEPLAYRESNIDYQHYVDKQLAPVADAILPFVNDSFARLTEQQGELF